MLAVGHFALILYYVSLIHNFAFDWSFSLAVFYSECLSRCNLKARLEFNMINSFVACNLADL